MDSNLTIVENADGTYTVRTKQGYLVANGISEQKLQKKYGVDKLGRKVSSDSSESSESSKSTKKADDFSRDVTSNEYLNSLIEEAHKNYANLNVDPNSAQSQQYLNDMYASINREQAETEASLSSMELDAYRQIGYQQQQLENQIAENRLKAIKSGTTSAQLAAQQLNNMFAAQTGAAEIANNAMNQRVSSAQEYAARRAAATENLYNQINQNKTTLATAGAQNTAAGLSYASYVNQQLAQLQANNSLYNKIGKKEYQANMGIG